MVDAGGLEHLKQRRTLMSHFLHFTACVFGALFGIIVIVSFFATCIGYLSGTQLLLIVMCCICGAGLCVQQGIDAYESKDK